MIGLTRDRSRFLAERLERATDEAVTYDEIGLTRGSTLPTGYNHDKVSLLVGDGEDAWSRAREAIRLWTAHAHAGITITPADASITEGTTVVASRNFGPVVIAAPCRVVYETEEPTRFGFAYGTLPGHPEKGEEAFHVVLERMARSKQRSWLSRGPTPCPPESPRRWPARSRRQRTGATWRESETTC